MRLVLKQRQKVIRTSWPIYDNSVHTYRAFSHDVTATSFVILNEPNLFSHVNTFIVPRNFHGC